MRIAQVAPLFESVPPRFYGGTERIVSFLTEELVRMGHDVTLFASGDSMTSARLTNCAPQALRLNGAVRDPMPYFMLMMGRLLDEADDFDLIHFHIDQFQFPLLRALGVPALTTLHGRQDCPDLKALYAGFPEMPLVSISNSQRAPIPNANFIATVHHGLPRDLLKPTYCPRGGYLAFLGRISPEKGVERAIELARTIGLPLKIAAKVDKVDQAYFTARVAPLLDGSAVQYIGEIDERAKNEFLGDALALLFPIDWPEPFGLVMIEAMACGTPVLAFRKGSVPEIIEDGVTGFVVSGLEEAAVALPKAIALDRRAVRRRFDERFLASRMAKDYLAVYRSLLRKLEFIDAPSLAPALTPAAPAAPDLNGASGLHAG